MPGAKVDFVWGLDFFNVHVSQWHKAPKITPEWKGRTAPKLGPKQPKASSSTVAPPSRPSLTSGKTGQKQIEDSPQKSAPKAPGATKKSIPKLNTSKPTSS